MSLASQGSAGPGAEGSPNRRMTIGPGTRLGPYDVVSALGSGGMGKVYRARDTRLHREVAIKVLPAEAASDAARLKRFEKEARAASALNHPNIVTIYAVDRVDSTTFIVMELVEGKTLREVLADGALPTRKLLAIASQIADGLAKAHASGIVHRDLKPENVMVTADGLVKILDFGLAKLAHPEREHGQPVEEATVSELTAPGIAMGTVGYMSPEQASGMSGGLPLRPVLLRLGPLRAGHGTAGFPGQDGPRDTGRNHPGGSQADCLARAGKSRRLFAGSWSGVSPKSRRSVTPRRRTSPRTCKPSRSISPSFQPPRAAWPRCSAPRRKARLATALVAFSSCSEFSPAAFFSAGALATLRRRRTTRCLTSPAF